MAIIVNRAAPEVNALNGAKGSRIDAAAAGNTASGATGAAGSGITVGMAVAADDITTSPIAVFRETVLAVTALPDMLLADAILADTDIDGSAEVNSHIGTTVAATGMATIVLPIIGAPGGALDTGIMPEGISRTIAFTTIDSPAAASVTTNLPFAGRLSAVDSADTLAVPSSGCTNLGARGMWIGTLAALRGC